MYDRTPTDGHKLTSKATKDRKFLGAARGEAELMDG
jgi:hypothetical protein